MGLSPFPQTSSQPLLYLPTSLPSRAPPSMPLPPIPGSKRLPETPNEGTTSPKRNLSGSMLPTLASITPVPSPPTQLPRKTSYQALRSVSNLPTRPRATTPTDDKSVSGRDSPQAPTSAIRPPHQRNVSIGAFPQPPRGTGSISSPDTTSPTNLSAFPRIPLRQSRSSSPLTSTSTEAKGKSPGLAAGRLPKTRARPSMIPGTSPSPVSNSGLPTPPPSAILPQSAPPSRPASDHGSSATQFEDIDTPVAPLTIKPRSRASNGSFHALKTSRSSSNLDDGRGNVVVSVRVRPNPQANDAGHQREDWSVDSRRAAITYKGGEGGDFKYDNVFNAMDDNEKVYDSAAKRLVRRVMEGYNGTVFAYGITGTGKTFSMQGTAQSPGIIPLAITDIFSYIREHPDREFLLRVSYLEIYNEKIHDLLSESQQDEIVLREDSKRGVYAIPLKEEIVQSPTQLLRVIARGDMARRTGSTQFNVRSSRSHAVVQIVIESRVRANQASERDLTGGVLISTLSLIDLAGSERAAEDKERRAEGSHINKSLLTLGTVISKLSGAKGSKPEDRKHLPYRDSKLTRLLQSALSGDALISILCTIQLSPLTVGALNAFGGSSDTLNTLGFASRAKNNIVSHAKRNQSLPASDAYALLDRYRAEIEDLKRQVEMQNQKEIDPVRTEEEEERWLEREREAAERHEEQMLEMQLARTALKERISHLNRLILSSRSAGVNVSTKLMREGHSPTVDGVGVALGSPELSGQRTSLIPEDASPVGLVGLGLRSFGSSTALQQAVLVEEDEEAESPSGSVGEASPRQQVIALQADLADKNRYIATLERRLLEGRRLASHKSRKSAGGDSSEELLAERDREIAELKSRLDDQTKMVQALRNAVRRPGMVDTRSRSAGQITAIEEGLYIDTSVPREQDHPSGMRSRTSSRPSLTSPTTRNINFSRVTPVATFPAGASTSGPKSMTDMTQALDQMLGAQDDGMKVRTSFTIHELPASPVLVGGRF